MSLVLAIAKTGRTQGMQLSKVIVAMAPGLKKDDQPAALKTFINKEILPIFIRKAHVQISIYSRQIAETKKENFY